VLHGAAGSSGSGVGTRRGAPVSPAARAFLELAERRLAEFGEASSTPASPPKPIAKALVGPRSGTL
jgi:hypothetical protein